MEDGKYNGWTNYETWCVSLWLSNDEETYRAMRCMAKASWNDAPRSKEMTEWKWSRQGATLCQLAKRIRMHIENENPSETSSLFTDLTNAALAEVDWPEIAETYLVEVMEEWGVNQGGKQ